VKLLTLSLEHQEGALVDSQVFADFVDCFLEEMVEVERTVYPVIQAADY
jgi:hypothetical protein